MAAMGDREVAEFIQYLEEMIGRKRAERSQTNCFRTWDLLETEMAEDKAILQKFLELTGKRTARKAGVWGKPEEVSAG